MRLGHLPLFICLKMARMWKQDILSLFAKNDNRLSGNLSKLTSTQFSAFLFCGLKVRPLESGTKQCSIHVHGGQVKSQAFLEVEIIFCQFEGSSVVGICWYIPGMCWYIFYIL